MSDTGLQLRTRVNGNGTLSLWLEEVAVPEPGPEEVLLRVGAAPINPSDLFLLFGPADPASAVVAGSAARPEVTLTLPEGTLPLVEARIGQALAAGNEGAGTVIAAGSSPRAQALLGRTVGVFGGEMYSQYRCVHALQCLPLEEGTSAEQGASCFVNPMTALGMRETLEMEGHAGLVHTAAASNLGQMLNRLCLADDIPLVNIVRRPEQVSLMRAQGAQHVVDTSSDRFMEDLIVALEATGATLAFDAVGGGKLVSQILTAMEAVALRSMTEYNRYGSNVFKQVYIYGALDLAPTTLTRNFGFAWGIGGWLLPQFLHRAGPERSEAMRSRVAREIHSTFASHYSHRISLAQMLDPAVMQAFNRRATGEKYLLLPWA